MTGSEQEERAPMGAPTSPPLLDLGLGLAFTVGGVALFVASGQFQAMIPGTPVGPGLMPRICALVFMLAGAALAINAARHLRDSYDAGDEETGTLGFSAVVLLGLLAVVWAAPYLGFAITAMLYSLAVTRAGGARWPGAILLALTTTVAVQLLFGSFMRVPLPRAELFPGLPF